MFVNQGSLPGQGCNSLEVDEIDNGVSGFEISACQVATPTWSASQDPFYISVFGAQAAFPEYGIPVRYRLSAEVSGDVQSIVSVGTSQLVENTQGEPVIYLYALQAFEDTVGQLKISVSLIAPNTGAILNGNAALNIYFNRVPFCADEPDLSLFVDSEELVQAVFLNSCDLVDVQMIYLQFDHEDSVTGANFEIHTTHPFIRDLDFYTDIPQSGAVVPKSSSSNVFIDEEYFRIQLNTSEPNFQFTAWLKEPVSEKFLLQASQVLPPSGCFEDLAGSGKYNITSVNGGQKLTVDWCEIFTGSQTYLTVSLDTINPQRVAHPYELYYSTQLESAPVTLQENSPLCDTVEGDSWKFYVIQLGSLSSSFFELTLTSVNSNSAGSGQSNCGLEVFFNNEGLATSKCTPDEWTLDCSGSCGSTSCSFLSNCFTSGNVSVGVRNTQSQDINYFISFSAISADAKSLTLSTAEAPAPLVVEPALGSDETVTYFSYVTPSTPLQPYEMLVFTAYNTDGNPISRVQYRESVIPGACGTTRSTCDETGEEGECTFTLTPCNFTAGSTLYFSVQTEGAFWVTMEQFTSEVISLDTSVYAEGSLATGSGAIQSYSFTITEDHIQSGAVSDVTVSIYGVNQGIVDAWISSSEDCSIDFDTFQMSTNSNQRKSSGFLYISSCELKATTYYITLRDRTPIDGDSCEPSSVTHGVAYFFGASSKTSTPLASGTAVSAPAHWENLETEPDFYTFSPASDQVFVVDIVPSHPRVDVTSTISGGDLCEKSFEGHYEAWFCGANSAPGSMLLSVLATARDDMSVPVGQSYSITASNMGFTDLTSTNVTDKTFTSTGSDQLETHYYSFTMTSNVAVQFDIEVLSGPAVQVSIYSDCGKTLISEVVCFLGHCYLPVSWASGDLAVTSTPYHLTVRGRSPAKYNLGIMVGEAQTCIPVTGSTMCDVEWSVWNYGQGEAGMNGTNLASIRLYHELLDAFVPPCEEVSKACNESLIEFVCTQTYRACDESGYQASICLDSCNDVEEKCGKSFTQVGYPQFECNHNYYYSNDDEICQDIYDVISDDSDKLLWLILLIVLFFIIVIFIAIAVFFGYKKYKSKRGYETLDDGNQYDEVHSGDDED